MHWKVETWLFTCKRQWHISELMNAKGYHWKWMNRVNDNKVLWWVKIMSFFISMMNFFLEFSWFIQIDTLCKWILLEFRLTQKSVSKIQVTFSIHVSIYHLFFKYLQTTFIHKVSQNCKSMPVCFFVLFR